MHSKNLRGSLLCLLAAAIWGAAFVAQSVGMDYVGPFTFNFTRMLLGSAVLVPVILWRDGRSPAHRKAHGLPELGSRRTLVVGGVCCGVMLFIGSTLQQIGIQYTTAGKAGFITALYVVLVPIAGWLIFRSRAGWVVWIGVFAALIALYLLCVPSGGFQVEKGDALLVGCAVCFTGQILCIDRYVQKVDGMALARDEFLLSGAVCMGIALLTEKISPEGILEAAVPILYTGIMSGAVGYTLQIYGQRTVNPTVASLLMCMESVFAVLTGIILLGEAMTAREAAGCVLMFAAVILAQLSPMISGRKKEAPSSPSYSSPSR